jgi:methylated-DNA-protein-cysteine methyltransferase-like protein
MNFFQKVYWLVKKIPAGRVTTYGELAKVLGTRDARRVGQALHANRDAAVPCHRVVNRDGGLAVSFAFGGQQGQKRRLEEEGIEFRGKMKVNLTRYCHKFEHYG